MQILPESALLINPATLSAGACLPPDCERTRSGRSRHRQIPAQAGGLVDELLDATIDATDQAHALGKEDATEGRRQDAFIYPANSPAWAAYHEGYREGAVMAAILTGTTRRYWDPTSPTEIQMVSWNSQPTLGLFKCPTCGTYYDPTYGGCPGCAAYVPFQLEPEAYADVRCEWDREDWVGA